MMTGSGRVLENPVLKDKITLLETGAETGGAYTLLRVELAPGGGVLSHYHDTFTETFEAVEGRLYLDLNGKTTILEPGQRVIVPLYAVHRFYNPTEQGQRISFTTRVEPARQFEKNLMISYGLARE